MLKLHPPTSFFTISNLYGSNAIILGFVLVEKFYIFIKEARVEGRCREGQTLTKIESMLSSSIHIAYKIKFFFVTKSLILLYKVKGNFSFIISVRRKNIFALTSLGNDRFHKNISTHFQKIWIMKGSIRSGFDPLWINIYRPT